MQSNNIKQGLTLLFFFVFSTQNILALPLNYTGGSINLTNGSIESFEVSDLTTDTNSHIYFDADFSGQHILHDTINISGTYNGSLDIGGINIINDGQASGFIQLFNGDTHPNFNNFNAYTNARQYKFIADANDPSKINIVSPDKDLIEAISADKPIKNIALTNSLVTSGDLGATSATGSSLLITGNGHGIDGNKNKGITVSAGDSIYMGNVGSFNEDGTIKNSYSNFEIQTPFGKGYATAFNNEGTAIIENSIVSDNKNINNVTASNPTSYAYGGAVYNKGNLIINNSYFANNTAEMTSLTNGFQPIGGALFNGTLGVVEINNSIFEDNHLISPYRGAGAFGGAFANEGLATIRNSTFKNHSIVSSSTNGGAIYDNYSKGLTIIGSTFENNAVKTNSTGSGASGGAIYTSGAKMNIYNSIFKNNSADSRAFAGTSGYASAYGGAINAFSGTLKFINTSFLDNLAIGQDALRTGGGAVYVGSNAQLYFVADGGNTIVKGNKAGSETDLGNIAIDVRGRGTSSNPQPFYIDASNGGKVVFDDKINATYAYTAINFNSNTLDGTGTSVWTPKGGEIYINEEILTKPASYDLTYNINGGIVKLGASSQSAADGNAILNPDGNLGRGTLAIKNGIISLANNTIGQASWNNIKATTNAQIHIDADFANATNDTVLLGTLSSSGTLYLTGLNIMSDGDIKQLKLFAPKSGTSLYAPTLSAVNAYTNDFKYALTANTSTKGLFDVKRTAATAKGGLYDAVYDSSAMRSYSTSEDITLGYSLGNMGGSTNALLTMLVNNHNIDGNTLNGITVASGKTLNIFDVGNTQDGQSNGFHNFDGTVVDNKGGSNIYHSVFSTNNNTVIKNGSTGILNINDAVFKNNTAATQGAAINNTATANIFGSAFTGNTSATGGAIYNTGTMNIVNTSFSNNTATGDGGAIYNTGTLTINANAKDINFKGNTADGASNAIALAGNGTLNLNVFEGNKIIFDDTVTALASNIININKDTLAGLASNGEIILNNNFGGNGAQVNLYGGILKVGKDNYLADNNLNLEGGILDLRNGQTGILNLTSLNSKAAAKLYIDINKAGTDTINTTNATGEITLAGLNVLEDIAGGNYTIFSDAAPTIIGSKTFTNNTAYEITAGSQAGTIDITDLGSYNGLSAALEDNGALRSFSATEDVYIAKDLPAFNGTASELTIFGNNHNIYGNDNQGIIVDTDKKLNILNAGSIADISGINGFAAQEGAFLNNMGTTLVSGSIINANTATAQDAKGGAISNSGKLTLTNSLFSGNNAQGITSALGGAINTQGTDNLKITNTSFLNNSANASDTAGIALGGAIYAAAGHIVDITSDGGNVIFRGNTANGVSNAIHLATGSALNLASAQGTQRAASGIVFDDAITSDDINNQININNALAPDTIAGNIYINNTISNATINLFDGNLFLAQDNFLDGNNLNATGGLIDLRNNIIGKANFNNINLAGDLKIAIDADLEAVTTDAIETPGSVSGNGNIVIESINIVKDSDTPTTIVPTVSDNLKDHVSLNSNIAYSALFKYGVTYDPVTGSFTFDNKGKDLNGYNPAVLAQPVAAQIGSYLAQNKAYNTALANIGNYATAFPKNKDREVWFTPYSDFGDVALKNGPKVDNLDFGALFGVDTYSRQMLFGMDGYYTFYAGYTGGSQKYEDIQIDNNGAIGGFGITMYSENFFTGLTVAAGYSANKAQTAYGKDDFNIISAGAALRMGYNLRFGAFILQPSITGSYTFVNPQDYTSANDVEVKGEALNVIQIAPTLKLAADIGKGWQPALEAAYIHSVFSNGQFTAATIAMPDIEVDPYFEYGLNIQKIWSKNFSTYLKGMLRTSGLEGGSVQLGIKLAI